MKSHLHKVKRIFDYTDKSEYDFILNQSERSQPIPEPYYTEFIRSLKQEDFAYYPNTISLHDLNSVQRHDHVSLTLVMT